MKNQIKSLIAHSCVLLIMQLFFLSCVEEETYSKASVETNLVTSITEATATFVGIITADGGSDVTTRGFCWSTSPNPTIESDTTVASLVTPVFSDSIKGLAPGTTYYVRAYAVNMGGVAYGQNEIFKTKTFSITTTPISVLFLTATSAIGGGDILSDGDSSSLTVIARGVCWNTFPSPTIENSRTFDGVGGGKFVSKIDSLIPFTTYYIRAYATNGNGTIYGNEVNFTTQNGVVDLTTTATSSITAYTASSGGTISSEGGAAVTSRGVCWGTSPSPTIENCKSENGSGAGTFTCSLTELTPGTTYFVRSYATNSVGTSYGNEESFTTQSGEISLITAAIKSTISYTATSGGTISSDGGAAVTARGVCWSTTPSPTISDSKAEMGSGIGSFTCSLTGLTPHKTYYIRSYATNSVGTSYGDELTFTSLGVIDIDGNVYPSVKLGTQEWMIENLKTTKLNDGTSIPNVTNSNEWVKLSTPGYCFLKNGGTVTKTNGAYYNWYTVNTGKLAPKGWHVPTTNEWTTLEDYLISNGYNFDGSVFEDKIAKSLASQTGWFSSTNSGTIGYNQSANNKSGFRGLPSGRCCGEYGSFYDVGVYCFLWSASDNLFEPGRAWFRSLNYDEKTFDSYYTTKTSGFSVRCVRD